MACSSISRKKNPRYENILDSSLLLDHNIVFRSARDTMDGDASLPQPLPLNQLVDIIQASQREDRAIGEPPPADKYDSHLPYTAIE